MSNLRRAAPMASDTIIRISHTQKELYLMSPKAWYFKYKLNLKEKVMGSPLFFGSIVEIGVEVLLKGGTLEQAHEAFTKAMKSYNVNGKWENLATSKNVRYSKADWQPHLFTVKEIDDMVTKTQQFRSHQSLIRSGKMMITEYHDNILPKIKKVIATQKYFSIDNGIGDEIMGYIDLICEWEDGRILAPDNKTSGSAYKPDCVDTPEKGTQTALYYEAVKDEYKLDGTGFLVLENKTIFSYKCTNYYKKDAEGAILWKDKTLNIDWHIEHPIISEKDKNAEIFANFTSPF